MVRVEVPENYVVMITMLLINVTEKEKKCDRVQMILVVYEYDMTEENTVWHCGLSASSMHRQRLPIGSDLYVHFKCGEISKYGFRLFFSVTKEPGLLTVGPGKDLWNCSVPNFADFKPHFPCDLYPQCVNKEDERDCPYFSDECGLGFVTLDTHCLVYIKGGNKLSWRDMEFQCQKRGMRIASFRKRKDYYRFVQYLEPLVAVLGFRIIAVGIHTSPASLPIMYKNEMQNTDGTIAFYKWTSSSNNVDNVCGSIVRKFKLYMTHIKLSFCSRKKPGTGDVVCEIPKCTAKNTPDSIELLPVSDKNNSHLQLIDCLNGHVTRNFLACDSQNVCWSRDFDSCFAPLTPLPPSFNCADGIESVPYTLVCNVRPDCSDGSDESFCEFPPCDLPEPFYCSDHECVPQSTVCDGQSDCYNEVDEHLCSGQTQGTVSRPLPPAIVKMNQPGKFTVYKMNNWTFHNLSVCPETHFQCPDNGYCMPVFLRCNGVYDCLGWEDEADCPSYTCPGFYRCRGSQVCLHPQNLCDGIFQCPQNDDELLCDFSCPEDCTCYGLAFYCRQPFQAKKFNGLRFLDSSGSGMSVSDLADNIMLIYLNMAANGLTSVGELHLPNLRVLDLSDNQLEEIHLQNISHLPHLVTLRISGNPLTSLFIQTEKNNGNVFPIHSATYSPVGNVLFHTTEGSLDGDRATLHPARNRGMTEVIFLSDDRLEDKSAAANDLSSEISKVNIANPSLRTLDLSRVKIKVLDLSFLSMLPNVHTVNMSGCGVDTLLGDGFQAATQIRALDLRGCPLTSFPRDAFRNLRELETVHSDNYKLCCPATLPNGFILKNCQSPSDLISSCDALLGTNTVRVFLSIFASLALLGNGCIFVIHILKQKNKLSSFDVFMTHIWVADFMMGVYLSIIWLADRLYQSIYLWEDNGWRNSAVCHVAGFLCLVSSEVSVLMFCLITIDRFLVLRFPSSTFRFNTVSANGSSYCVWMLGCLIAAVPFAPSLSHWRLYSQTGICIPIPVKDTDSPGFTFVFGIMVLANLSLFIGIAAGQLFIYWSVQTNLMSFSDTIKSQPLIIARRLMTVAISDFLCWFVIGLLGMLAASGTAIAGEVRVNLAVLVLPFNSAINPFLYTFNILLEKRRQADEARIKERLIAQFRAINTNEKTVSDKETHRKQCLIRKPIENSV